MEGFALDLLLWPHIFGRAFDLAHCARPLPTSLASKLLLDRTVAEDVAKCRLSLGDGVLEVTVSLGIIIPITAFRMSSVSSLEPVLEVLF